MVGIVDRRVIDNRVLLLGLDHLYREAIKSHERSELLACARDLAVQVQVGPASVPVEGYYAGDADLTEYFLLMRALQAVDGSSVSAAASSVSYERLCAVASSRLFGTPTDDGKLLPSGRDALTKALESRPPSAWSVPHLTEVAHEFSQRDDEISLVGLAARAGDSVMLAALRESVVLYAARAYGSAIRLSEPEYVWKVDEGLARQALRFVEEFNRLFQEDLPVPKAENAETFWRAAQGDIILGRCVCIGVDDSSRPVRYYHWAVVSGDDGKPRTRERWDSEIWTTERFRRDSVGESTYRFRAPGSS